MHFSIIIPLYNKEPYIEKALKSVKKQTFEDYELIVVDDGSKDDSAIIAESCLDELWGDNPTQVRLIRQNNTGVSTARNNGVDVSHGEYICFLDADDWWEPTFLEEMSQLITNYPDAGIYGTNYTIVNETKHKTRIAPIAVEKDFQSGYINYCQVYAKTLAMPLWTGAVCIPRSIFGEFGGFKSHLTLGEDFDLWIRIALKYKVVFLNKVLSNYNQDVDVVNRGVGHLHNPQTHMLWNLSYLEPIEQTNPDYKQLIDKLRVNGLLSYFLSEEYHDVTVTELQKIDWTKQSVSNKRIYRSPIWYLRLRHNVLKLGSQVKQFFRKIY